MFRGPMPQQETSGPQQPTNANERRQQTAAPPAQPHLGFNTYLAAARLAQQGQRRQDQLAYFNSITRAPAVIPHADGQGVAAPPAQPQHGPSTQATVPFVSTTPNQLQSHHEPAWSGPVVVDGRSEHQKREMEREAREREREREQERSVAERESGVMGVTHSRDREGRSDARMPGLGCYMCSPGGCAVLGR
jgi:hypothetical protein